jgi:hypothetical protein
MREPLWAAWIVELSGASSIRAQAAPQIDSALRHYRWDRLYSSTFFIAVTLGAVARQ